MVLREIPVLGGIVTNNETIKIGFVIGVILLFIVVGIQPAIALVQKSVDFNDEVKQSLNYKQGEYLSLFYGDIQRYVEKTSLNQDGSGGMISTKMFTLYLDADLEELKIELILNYTAEMNYTLKWPFNFAPIFAFGIKIQNTTNYEWEYFKLKHHGYSIKTGNFSIVINVDMTSIESGDEVIIQPTIYWFTIPLISPDKTNKSLCSFIRLIYHIPILNELLLTNWLFPIFGDYEDNSVNTSRLYLYFK